MNNESLYRTILAALKSLQLSYILNEGGGITYYIDINAAACKIQLVFSNRTGPGQITKEWTVVKRVMCRFRGRCLVIVFLPRDAMIARCMLWPCVRLCLSVTSQCSTKTAKHMIT